MSDLMFAFAYIAAVFVILFAGYVITAVLTWCTVNVLWNTSPRFRTWIRKKH